ncbi:hypothetical protein [Ruegeria atlantica]|nr:hypothetical protein [Ruegeria atlantica]
MAALGMDAAAEQKKIDGATNLDRVTTAVESGGLIWPPYVVGSLSIGLFNDHTFQADDPNEKINDIFGESRLEAFVFLSRNIYVETGWLVEPVDAPIAGRDRFLEAHALKWGALSLTFESGDFWISAGKGPVHFGIAESVAPGIYGSDIASDFYAIKGRVGVGANYGFDAGDFGSHALRGGVFTLDTSWLATPFFSDFDPPKRSTGGAGNTNGLKNWAIALDGGGIDVLPGFRYHLSYVNQQTEFLRLPNGKKVPRDALGNEHRYAAAITWLPIALIDELSVTPFVEYARLENARGRRNRTEGYLTSSLDLQYRQWSLALAATGWEVKTPDGSRTSNLQAQISAGYTFDNGVTFEAGFRSLNEDNENSETFGLALNYELPFAF